MQYSPGIIVQGHPMVDLKDAFKAPPAPEGAPGKQECQWAMFAHLSALAGALLAGGWGFGLGCIAGPLVIWLVKKDEMPFVDDQGREALNFNMTVAIVLTLLMLLSGDWYWYNAFSSAPGYLLIAIVWLALTIMAALKAKDGVAYRYPLALRLVS